MCPARNSFHACFQPLLLGKKGHSLEARSLQWALCKMLLISICQAAVSAGQRGDVSSFSSASHGQWIMLGTGQAAARCWQTEAIRGVCALTSKAPNDLLSDFLRGPASGLSDHRAAISAQQDLGVKASPGKCSLPPSCS